MSLFARRRRREKLKHNKEYLERQKVWSKDWKKEHPNQQKKWCQELSQAVDKHCVRCGKLLCYTAKRRICQYCWRKYYGFVRGRRGAVNGRK